MKFEDGSLNLETMKDFWFQLFWYIFQIFTLNEIHLLRRFKSAIGFFNHLLLMIHTTPMHLTKL